MTESDFELIMMKSEKTLKKESESTDYQNKVKWYKVKIGSGWYEVTE